MVRLAVLAACLAFAGCDNPPTTPTSPQPPPGVEQITGSERIGWDQEAGSAGDLGAFRYLMYVDGSPVELQGVACDTSRGAGGFPCRAPLPPLTPGLHTLELSSFVESGGRQESPRSAPLRVQVVARLASTAPFGAPLTLQTTDGVRFAVALVADGLEAPTDIAFTPDGRAFVAERSGRVRVVRDGRLQPAPAIALDDVAAGEQTGLFALAVDPRFEETGFVFALYTADAGLRLSRFRAVGDRLGERAIVMDAVAGVETTAARLRFGPDGRLYVAIGDGGDARRAGDLGSYSGKILRIDRDGTTPADQSGGTPVFLSDVNGPRGLDWGTAAAGWWLVEADADGMMRLQAVTADAQQSGRGQIAVRYNLPHDAAAAGLAVYRSARLPALAGDVLVADAGSGALLRFRVDRSDGLKIVGVERLLAGSLDEARGVAVSPDGVIWVATANALVTLTSDAGAAPR